MNFNGNPYTVPAIVLGAAIILAGITWLYIASLAGAGRHARPARHAHAAAPFADPRDVTDPEGQRFVEDLHGDLGKPPPRWRDQEPPAVRFDTTPGALARLRDALQDWTPGAPAAVIMARDPHEPEPGDTGQLPAAVCTWGMTAPELADKLAARYLT